ncbi:hypothetical protein EVAR_5010_1 [Eumeta japonica]|uniref:Uncharacterized protein n=1 Tax=Eumeta variegata TaxID=151549 RepID=A0A4C1SWG9_EUMVA|nr:hypothetical protein EVAR_5010_1 [Eumeta japonica]
MRTLRNTRGVFLKNRYGNSDVRDRRGLKDDVVTTVEKNMLQWFDHLDRMNESRLAKQIYRTNMCDGRASVYYGFPRIDTSHNTIVSHPVWPSLNGLFFTVVAYADDALYRFNDPWAAFVVTDPLAISMKCAFVVQLGNGSSRPGRHMFAARLSLRLRQNADILYEA